MKPEMKNVIDAEYKIYDQRTRATYTIRESPDIPGVTEILQSENGEAVACLSMRDDDVLLLIKALQRRMEDVKISDDLAVV